MGILFITVFVVIVASFSLSSVYAEPVIYDDDYIVEKFVGGLGFPTTMTFVGDEILILEKSTGKVIRIQSNGVPYSEPALHVPVEVHAESGLLGISEASNLPVSSATCKGFLFLAPSVSNLELIVPIKYGTESP